MGEYDLFYDSSYTYSHMLAKRFFFLFCGFLETLVDFPIPSPSDCIKTLILNLADCLIITCLKLSDKGLVVVAVVHLHVMSK